MTLFISDTSGYQPDFDYAGSGLDAHAIKATEGSTYRNPSFAAQLSRARATGKPTIAYHYVHAGDVAGQLANIRGAVSAAAPVMLDLEAGGDVATTRSLASALRSAGYVVPLLYCPAWWLSANGGLNIDTRSIAPLWSSQYPAGGSNLVSVYAAAGGDSGPGWGSYGGQAPALWQFSSSISIGGYSAIDVSAYRGTRTQLAALLGGTPGRTNPMEFLVDLSTVQPDESYTDVARVQGSVLAGSTWSDATALQRNSAPGAVIIYGMAHTLYVDAVAASDAVKKLPAQLAAQSAALLAAVAAIPAAGGTPVTPGAYTINGTVTPAIH